MTYHITHQTLPNQVVMFFVVRNISFYFFNKHYNTHQHYDKNVIFNITLFYFICQLLFSMSET